MSGRKKSSKRSVEDNVRIIKKYIEKYERKPGDEPTIFEIILDEYAGNKSNYTPNTTALINDIASLVVRFHNMLQNRRLDKIDEINKTKNKIRTELKQYSKTYTHSKWDELTDINKKFVKWLMAMMIIHKMSVINMDNLHSLVVALAYGVDFEKHLTPLPKNNPQVYTFEIAKIINVMVKKFALEKKNTKGKMADYMNVLTEDDADMFDLIADRVADDFKKKLDYDEIYEWSTILRNTLKIIIANIFALLLIPDFDCFIQPQDIRHTLDECFKVLRMIIARREVQQIEQRILMVDEKASLKDAQETTDFSVAEWTQLTGTIRKKAASRKKPKSKTTPRQSSNLQSKTPRPSSTLQSKTPRPSSIVQSTQQHQKKSTVAARVPVSLLRWLQQAPILQSRVIPNPRFQSLRQRKQSNIPLIKEQVETFARDILKKAVDARAKSIVLVDVRNLGNKRHPGKGFQQKFRQLAHQADALLRQQVSINDASQTISKPFFVFVDQGTLKEGLKMQEVGDRMVRIQVPCFKDAGHDRVDCYYALQQQQQDQARKNPMDDYVLLSLHSILMSYYKQYIEALGGDVQQQMDDIHQFIRRNPGVARYSADMVEHFRQRVAQLHQLHRKIAKDAIKPYILSGDLFRDWIIRKNEILQQSES